MQCEYKYECSYYLFFDYVSCLFVEGVEFMTRDEIYEAIKRKWKEQQLIIANST